MPIVIAFVHFVFFFAHFVFLLCRIRFRDFVIY